MNPQLPANLNDRMQVLKQRASQNTTAEIWQPMAGDTLIGVLIGSETTQHPIYGQQRLMLVQKENGEVVKVWLSKWLIENLRAQDAQQHDLIALTYGGKHRTTSGREYNAYNLIVDKP